MGYQPNPFVNPNQRGVGYVGCTHSLPTFPRGRILKFKGAWLLWLAVTLTGS